MKCKILAVMGSVNPSKKKAGAGMVNVAVAYPDGKRANHVIYSDNIVPLQNLKDGDVVDVDGKMEEFVFLRSAS